jgi:hypothetical protein
VAEHLRDLENARSSGLLKWFGASGESENVARVCSEFGKCVQVIQVSVNDACRFDKIRQLRCFGLVRHLAIRIRDLAEQNHDYGTELLAALYDVPNPGERFALAGIAVGHVIFPKAVLVVTSNNENHIANMTRYFGEPALLSWATAHSGLHRKIVSSAIHLSVEC